jgi:hypothetical protein
LSLSGKLGATLPLAHIAHYLNDLPSIRPHVLDYLTRESLNRKKFEIVENFICAPIIIDDAALLDGAYAINECVVRQDFGAEVAVERVVAKIANKGAAGLYASLWLFSKHAEAQRILEFLRETFDRWRADSDIGRLVGGLWPIMRGVGLSEQLDKLIRRARNAGALATMGFHESLIHDTKTVAASRSFLKNPNPSKPLRITHAKFLLLLSLLQNDSLPEREKASYINIHHGAWRDIFYSHRARELPLSRRLRRLI